jgi:hypothetical protein
MSAAAVVEGTGWPPHEMAINSASTEFDLVAAFQNLHSELLSGACFANEQAVKQTCMAKYNNVGGSKGGVWTRSCAQWYLRCMNTFAAPVIPVAAYEGQYFPPAYLFTPPPSALIPVVPIPAPVMIVADAVLVPEHNDAAWAMPVPTTVATNMGPIASATPIAEGKMVAAAEQQPQATSAAAAQDINVGETSGGAMWVDFDKNVSTEPAEIVQVPFVYTPPADGSACWVNDDKVPIPASVVQQNVQIVQPRAQPTPERVLDMYKDGDETTTDVWCTPEEQFDTTHLNLWNNDVSKIEGLHKFPNLLRLTLRSNEIKNLRGVSDARNLRWLDVSDNDVNSLKGLEGMSSLEWLDVHNNEFTSLEGMGTLPQLTFLNMRHSDLKHVIGIDQMLPRLRYIDLSSNDLYTIKGLEKLIYLTEINLNTNDLKDFAEIKPLLRLPYLARLDISNNQFSAQAINNFKKIIKEKCPKLQLICNSGTASASSSGVQRTSSNGGSGESGCCTCM